MESYRPIMSSAALPGLWNGGIQRFMGFFGNISTGGWERGVSTSELEEGFTASSSILRLDKLFLGRLLKLEVLLQAICGGHAE